MKPFRWMMELLLLNEPSAESAPLSPVHTAGAPPTVLAIPSRGGRHYRGSHVGEHLSKATTPVRSTPLSSSTQRVVVEAGFDSGHDSDGDGKAPSPSLEGTHSTEPDAVYEGVVQRLRDEFRGCVLIEVVNCHGNPLGGVRVLDRINAGLRGLQRKSRSQRTQPKASCILLTNAIIDEAPSAQITLLPSPFFPSAKVDENSNDVEYHVAEMRQYELTRCAFVGAVFNTRDANGVIADVVRIDPKSSATVAIPTCVSSPHLWRPVSVFSSSDSASSDLPTAELLLPIQSISALSAVASNILTGDVKYRSMNCGTLHYDDVFGRHNAAVSTLFSMGFREQCHLLQPGRKKNGSITLEMSEAAFVAHAEEIRRTLACLHVLQTIHSERVRLEEVFSESEL